MTLDGTGSFDPDGAFPHLCLDHQRFNDPRRGPDPSLSWGQLTTLGITPGTYSVQLQVAGDQDGFADATTTLNVDSVSIATDPSSQVVAAGSGVTFTASATGVPSPTVQWELSTDGGTTFSAISGATLTTYQFSAVAGENGYEYEAVFASVGDRDHHSREPDGGFHRDRQRSNQPGSCGGQRRHIHGLGHGCAITHGAVGTEHQQRQYVRSHCRRDFDHLSIPRHAR